VRFDYYERLSAKDRRIYRKSDAIAGLPLVDQERHRPAVLALRRALATERRAEVEQAAVELVRQLTRALRAPPVSVRVLAKRPKNHAGELHGLYTLESDGSARIEVWMRTAEKKRVVAFRTFLRTLLHELCHHLDLTLLGLGETFHTEGFFRRESSLVRQLSPKTERAPAPRRTAASPEQRRRPEQLRLFSGGG
jgi:hypothetical protein